MDLALVEQQYLDGYAAIVDHAAKQKAIFDLKVQWTAHAMSYSNQVT